MEIFEEEEKTKEPKLFLSSQITTVRSRLANFDLDSIWLNQAEAYREMLYYSPIVTEPIDVVNRTITATLGEGVVEEIEYSDGSRETRTRDGVFYF